MNDAACIVVTNLINLAVRMLPIFVCLEPKRKGREIIAAVSVYLWVIMIFMQSVLRISARVMVGFQGVFSCLFFLVLLIFFQGKLLKKSFLYVSAWMFGSLAVSLNEFFAWMLRAWIFLSYRQVCMIVTLVSACGFYFFVRFWLKDTANQLFSRLSVGSCSLLLTYPVIGLVIIWFGSVTIFSPEALATRGFGDVVFYLALSVMILVLYILILNSTLEITERRRTEEELVFARQLIGKQREHYNQMLEHMEQVRIIRHDFRHHIYALLHMEKEEQTRYLLNLQKELEASAGLMFCENQAVNGLLQSYDRTCREYGIRFQTQLDLSHHIPVDDLTLCIVIGNLMENAVEACRRLAENRFIRIQGRWVEDHLVMIVENSFNGQIRQKGETLLSSKKDGGLGMLSIRRVLNRQGDDFDICFNENVFTAMVKITDRTLG